ncbi:MAG: hypothetical protein ACI9O6_002419 [Glaciecola sp.]
MAETINTAEAALQISTEIFETFKWKISELYDQNLTCEVLAHEKKTHPSDCVFFYPDPYTGKIVYFNTDLKSYGAKTINNTSVKKALKSLAMATHCASITESWKNNYILPNEQFDHEVRGFLFVYNHDSEYSNDFHEHLAATNPSTLPIVKDTMLHVFGPAQIEECFAISSDLEIQKSRLKISKYSFWYPDMILHKVRHGDIWDQAATVETLVNPIIILKYQDKNEEQGFIIYYRRSGETVDEFVYLIDVLSHYQILSQGLKIDLRFIAKNRSDSIRTNFRNAKYRYMQAWSLDEERERQLNLINQSQVNRLTSHYNIGELGWKES